MQVPRLVALALLWRPPRHARLKVPAAATQFNASSTPSLQTQSLLQLVMSLAQLDFMHATQVAVLAPESPSDASGKLRSFKLAPSHLPASMIVTTSAAAVSACMTSDPESTFAAESSEDEPPQPIANAHAVGRPTTKTPTQSRFCMGEPYAELCDFARRLREDVPRDKNHGADYSGQSPFRGPSCVRAPCAWPS